MVAGPCTASERIPILESDDVLIPTRRCQRVSEPGVKRALIVPGRPRANLQVDDVRAGRIRGSACLKTTEHAPSDELDDGCEPRTVGSIHLEARTDPVEKHVAREPVAAGGWHPGRSSKRKPFANLRLNDDTVRDTLMKQQGRLQA